MTNNVYMHGIPKGKIIRDAVHGDILAKKSEAKFEMAFDHVTYQDDSGHKAYDYQIEIELKSDYIHRVNLKMLTDDLERKVSKLESSTESKYKRGLTKLSVQ